MASPDSGVSIIVPAFREAPNIAQLVERVFAATEKDGLIVELLIVDDDSRDGTDAIVASLQARYPVRLIVRTGERGLSGAVLRGFAEAEHDTFVVMDADLQHPPEQIPQFVRRLGMGDCDFVIGTRYAGGAIAGNWPWYRRIGSTLATLLARPLAPVSDPMSGYFALSRVTWQQSDSLDPVGYKIALELIVKNRCRRLAEIPIEFAVRHAGQSKAGLREMLRYLRHLSRLYRYKYPVLSHLFWIGILAAVGLLAAYGALRP